MTSDWSEDVWKTEDKGAKNEKATKKNIKKGMKGVDSKPPFSKYDPYWISSFPRILSS